MNNLIRKQLVSLMVLSFHSLGSRHGGSQLLMFIIKQLNFCRIFTLETLSNWNECPSTYADLKKCRKCTLCRLRSLPVIASHQSSSTSKNYKHLKLVLNMSLFRFYSLQKHCCHFRSWVFRDSVRMSVNPLSSDYTSPKIHYPWTSHHIPIKTKIPTRITEL